MRSFIKRSEQDRRQAIKDVEYFARGGDERRSPGAGRRASGHRFDVPERTREPLPILHLFRCS